MSRKKTILWLTSNFYIKLPQLIIRNLMFCELQFRNYGKNGLFPTPPYFLDQCSQICFLVVKNIALMPALSHSLNLQGTSDFIYIYYIFINIFIWALSEPELAWVFGHLGAEGKEKVGGVGATDLLGIVTLPAHGNWLVWGDLPREGTVSSRGHDTMQNTQ